MADETKIITPYDNVPFLELTNESLESRHGANYFSNVKQFAAGFGAEVFRVDRDGMWLGAETFAAAPFSVDMKGNVTLTSITAMTGFYDTDLTSIALPTNGIRVDSNGIYGRKAGVTTFSLDTSGDATFTGTITGGIVRTASSGERVQMLESTNTLQILDSAGIVRAESYSNGFEFSRASGTVSGRVFTDDINGYLNIDGTDRDILHSTLADINFHVGTGALVYVSIDGGTRNLRLLNGADLEIGDTTIVGGGSWTFTLPSTDGLSGEFLQTDGAGNTTWAAVSGGADTDLNNLVTTSINESLIPAGTTQDLGTSALPWDRAYVDDIYLTNGDGNILYNGNIALDFYATRIEMGSSYDDFSPSSSLAQNLGQSGIRWANLFVANIDLTGDIDMNDNMITAIDEIRFITGQANTAGTEGAMTFYDSGTIQYRGQIVSTEYSFDLTAA